MKHVSYTPCWTDDSQVFPSHIVVIDGKGAIRDYTPELLCDYEPTFIAYRPENWRGDAE